MKHPTVISLLLFGGLVIAGCSSSDNDGARAVESGSGDSSIQGELDACALMTQAEVEATLGQEVVMRADQPANMELQGGAIVNSKCYYDIASSDGMAGLNITLRPGAEYPKTFAEFIEVSRGEVGADEEALETATSVEGVGDLAVWMETFGVGGLTAYAKDYKVLVLVTGTGADLDAAKSLASKVVAKL